MRGRIVLCPDGKGFIEGDIPLAFPQLTTGKLRRATHILPMSFFLRSLFILLRRLFGDNGRVAAWTRRWRCNWLVDFSPLGRDQRHGPFRSYADAVEYEQEEVLFLLLNRLTNGNPRREPC